MKTWIETPSNEKHIAYQMLEGGYIPCSPYGGRHIQDDYGNLIQALPTNYHKPLVSRAKYIGHENN